MGRHFCQLALVVILPTFLAAQQTQTTEPAANNAAASSQTGPQAALLDGTPVKLRISETISSGHAHVGEEVPFEVLEDVDVDGVPVIAKGATAIGTVTEAKPKRRMGRAGKLNISINYVRLRDGEKADLRAMKDANGKGHVGAMTGAIVATSVVFFPAAPLFLFMHGKNITIPEGTEITAFVQGDMHLDMARFEGSGNGIPASPAASKCTLAVSSSPSGAEIDIDGAFVGDTPSTLDVKPGVHEVTVKEKGYADWSRKLSVTGGNIHLDATLSRAAGS